MYNTGDGVPADGAKAVEYYEKGCAARDGKDCKQAARAYGYGDLVPQDVERAKVLSDKACQLGYDKCKPPLANGSWPLDAKLEDVIVDAKKWDGQFVQLRGVSAYRGSPTSGYIFAPGGKPLTDGVPTLMDDEASPDAKKAWLQMPSSRDGIPVKKVMVRVQATMVPGKAHFFIVDDLQFYGTGGK
jgi:TPR repeat protein